MEKLEWARAQQSCYAPWWHWLSAGGQIAQKTALLVRMRVGLGSAMLALCWGLAGGRTPALLPAVGWVVLGMPHGCKFQQPNRGGPPGY